MITGTALDRETTIAGALAEYDAFARLLESLDEQQWRARSRCAGFDVRDVAGHVVGLAEDTAAGVPGTRTAEEEAASVRDDTPAHAAARLRAATDVIGALLNGLDEAAWDGPSGLPDLTLGRGVLTLWYDTYVHADDVRNAIGLPSERGAGLEACVAYLTGELERRGWGPATLSLSGTASVAVGSGGPVVTGDPLQFVLVATGRADPSALGLGATVNIYAA
jgi:uncharacterized protein (TIGR03083 family)